MRHRPAAARVLAVAALLGLLAAAFVPGCARKPDAPVWSNPFDPAAGTDPFHLTARATDGSVILFWSRPAFADIAAFEVLHSLDNLTYAVLNETLASATSYIDFSYVPNRVNYYKIQARNAAGEVSGVSRQVAASGLTYPRLAIAAGASSTSTRHVILSIVTAAGDSLEIADNAAFAGALQLAADTVDTNFVPWDLGAAGANDLHKHVWLRVKSGAVYSYVAQDSIQVSFRPDLQILGRPATVATRLLALDIAGGTGATRLRFAPTRADLSAAAWSAPDSFVAGHLRFTGEVLGATAAPQWLYGEFESDFGFTSVDSLQCLPDDLATATFQLAGGARITPTATVVLTSVAVATGMRFGEGPDLSAVPWGPWTGTSEFTLSDGAGVKVVYGQFRNDWFSAVRTDTITYSPTTARARR
ncbi:MAG: hypothetical protein ACYDIE_00980 [Candidatus Krumholzibacteriia bacterium]